VDERVTSSGVEDALVAGYLCGLQNGYRPEDALKLGLAAARYTAGRMGNDFGTLDEINALVPSTAEPAAV
jgi:fructose-1-phosphate kinase PfkB-like protein